MEIAQNNCKSDKVSCLENVFVGKFLVNTHFSYSMQKRTYMYETEFKYKLLLIGEDSI